MRSQTRTVRTILSGAILLLGASGFGCNSVPIGGYPPDDVPHETRMTALPAYRVEPPDILVIDTVSVVPKPPYRIAALDFLYITATNTLPNEPISGPVGVEPDGNVNLGASYGLVRVYGLT